MQQLPALPSATSAPTLARSESAAATTRHPPAAGPEVLDLSRSQRPLGKPRTPISDPWRQSNPRASSPLAEDGRAATTSGRPADSAFPLQPNVAGFFAQLIGQRYAGRDTAEEGAPDPITVRASSAYRQAGAEPSLTTTAARQFDFAV